MSSMIGCPLGRGIGLIWVKLIDLVKAVHLVNVLCLFYIRTTKSESTAETSQYLVYNIDNLTI